MRSDTEPLLSSEENPSKCTWKLIINIFSIGIWLVLFIMITIQDSKAENSVGTIEAKECTLEQCNGCDYNEDYPFINSKRRRLPTCADCCMAFMAHIQKEFCTPRIKQNRPYPGAPRPMRYDTTGVQTSPDLPQRYDLQDLFDLPQSRPGSPSTYSHSLRSASFASSYKSSPLLGPSPDPPFLMDVFLIRHGESMANVVKELGKEGKDVTLSNGETISASEFYAGCNKNPIPPNIHVEDCIDMLQDAKLTEKGLQDALDLHTLYDQWAKPNPHLPFFESKYDPTDARLFISPLRRSAVTALMPFKDHLAEIEVEVEFAFRELQYTLKNGLFPENEIQNYPAALAKYVAETDLAVARIDYNVKFLRKFGKSASNKFVTNIWMNDHEHPMAPGCPRDPTFFARHLQQVTERARSKGNTWVVIGTHSYVIKCLNRELSLMQTDGIPDQSNEFYLLGGYLLENGAVERITWDVTGKMVLGGPTMVHKSLSCEAYFNEVHWPKPGVPKPGCDEELQVNERRMSREAAD